MGLVLDHTVIPASDQDASARFFAELCGLPVPVRTGPFTAVTVNDDLTLDFEEGHTVVPVHCGFLTDDATFDHVLGRLEQWSGTPFGSGPENGWDRAINHLAGGRGVYVGDPDGHIFEFFTVPPS